MTKHTPTPWRIDGTTRNEIFIGNSKETPIFTLLCANKANAQFIVTAVNSHDELVDALQNLSNYCKDVADDYCVDDDQIDHFQSDELMNLIKKAEQALSKVGK